MLSKTSILLRLKYHLRFSNSYFVLTYFISINGFVSLFVFYFHVKVNLIKRHFKDNYIDLSNIYSKFQHTYDSNTHTHSHTLTLNSIWVIGHETDLVFTIEGLPHKTINLFHLYFYQQQGIIPSIYFSFNNHLLQNSKQHCQDYVFVDRVGRLTKHNEPLKCIL